MSLFAKRAVNPPDPLQVSPWIVGNNWSGESVNETSALEVAAVFAAVSLLADSVASLPIRSVRHVGDRVESRPVPRWLSGSSTVTQYELIHMIVSSLALHGNAYIYIDRENGTLPLSLTPLHPNNVQVNVINRQRYYTVNGGTIPQDSMLHIRWWTPPQAATGLSPIEMQKTTIGLALSMERHLAQFYGEGATPSSVLEVDGDLTADQAKALQATWETQNRRRRRPAVLTNGMKWRSITADAASMEMNASRELQIAQVARIFRVPAYMIGARGESNTYTNNEAAGQHFVTYTLLPWLRRIEAALSSLMPSPQELMFDTAGFLRADQMNRYRAHGLGIQYGFLTPNEARAVEGLEPYFGGNEFVMALPGSPMAGPGIDPPPMGIDEQPPI
jgi:HK97 family phage portal protein